jgi:enoyl-CoA hydratase/carnithine racemase
MVVNREELYSTAVITARKILSCNTIAIRYAKEAITRGLDLTLEDGLALERRLAYILKDLVRKDASHSITGATA